MNVISPHNLIGNGTIKMCGFVHVGMALLEECVTIGVSFDIPQAQDTAKDVT